MSPRTFPHDFDEAADLRDARRQSDESTVAERCDEATAMFILSVIDIARNSASVDDYLDRIDREPPGCPSDRWSELQAQRAAKVSG